MCAGVDAEERKDRGGGRVTRAELIAASEAYMRAIWAARGLPMPERQAAYRAAMARLKEEYAKVETEEVRL